MSLYWSDTNSHFFRETHTQYQEKINVWEGSFIHLFFMSVRSKIIVLSLELKII